MGPQFRRAHKQNLRPHIKLQFGPDAADDRAPYSVVFSLGRAFSVEALNIRVEYPLRRLCVALRDDATSQILRKFERFTKAAFSSFEDKILHADRNALWQGGE